MSTPNALQLTIEQAVGAWLGEKAAEPERSVEDILSEPNDLSACLWPLLKELNFNGTQRHVAEAVPHFIDALDITAFCNTLAVLHYRSQSFRIALGDLDPRLMPCLFLPDGKPAMVVVENKGGLLRAFDSETGTYREFSCPRWRGTAYIFRKIDLADDRPGEQWMRNVAVRFKRPAFQAFAITFFLNLLVLAAPLFVMAIYDRVVATGSIPTLAYLASGIAIAINADLVLRWIRAKVLAFVGARVDVIVGSAVFQKLLSLPLPLLENTSVGAQVARLRDFENVRDFFTGPMVLAIFELPFTLLLVVVVALVAGPLALIPVGIILLFCVIGFAISPAVSKAVSQAARSSSQRQELIAQALSEMRVLRQRGAEDTWVERYRDLSAAAAIDSFRMNVIKGVINNTAHLLMVGAGVATIVFGTYRVLEAEMSMGALIATMILVWRVLAPLQVAFVTFGQLAQIRASIRQIDALMAIRSESDPELLTTPVRKVSGRITFASVSFRHSPDSDPSLVGVNFEIEPGDILAVIGPTGSGKSTVLRLLMGLASQQVGSIQLDGADIRQMDPVELRHIMAYMPQSPRFFYGTIAQNLRLSEPMATEEDLQRAAAETGVLSEIMSLPDGFDTRIGDARTVQLPASMQRLLSMTRALIKRSPIMVLDEPGAGLDYAGDQALTRLLEQAKGNTTVVMVTHRPGHLRIATKILWLEGGMVRAFGPAEEIRAQLSRDFQ